MSYSKVQILPDGNLYLQTGEELKHTDFIAHTSIAKFLKSSDYEIIQIFGYKHEHQPGRTVEQIKKSNEYFKNPINRKYHIVYSLDHPDRCWKVWDNDISGLYKIVCGDGEPVILERMPFHSDYYISRENDDILFHQKEQIDIRNIKLNKLIEDN
jgi:hypothetical protein